MFIISLLGNALQLYYSTSCEEVKIKKAATKCSRIDVTMELNELMFNMPELFVD